MSPSLLPHRSTGSHIVVLWPNFLLSRKRNLDLKTSRKRLEPWRGRITEHGNVLSAEGKTLCGSAWDTGERLVMERGGHQGQSWPEGRKSPQAKGIVGEGRRSKVKTLCWGLESAWGKWGNSLEINMTLTTSLRRPNAILREPAGPQLLSRGANFLPAGPSCTRLCGRGGASELVSEDPAPSLRSPWRKLIGKEGTFVLEGQY